MGKPVHARPSDPVRVAAWSTLSKENEMAIEYLLVTYQEQRAVLADGDSVGFTNHTLMLPTDEYRITLDGSGYQPPSQDVPLAGTSLVKPMVIAFTPTSPPAAPSSPGAARSRARRTRAKRKKHA